MSDPSAPAGWYDDGTGQRRYWDGAAWTEHTVPGISVTLGTPTAPEAPLVGDPTAQPPHIQEPPGSAAPTIPVNTATAYAPATGSEQSQGAFTEPAAPYGFAAAVPYAAADGPEGQKSFIATWLLAWLVGLWGIDRFYLGKIGTGLAKLFTLGGLGIWWLVDLILVLAGAQRDSQGYRLQGYHQHKKIAWIVTGAVVALGLITNIITGATGAAQFASNTNDRPAAFVEASDDAEPEAKPAPAAEPEPETVTVPNGLVGMTANDAANALAAVGLTAVYDGDPTAKVLSISPATASVEAGATITLTVEQPPAMSMGQQQAISKAKDYLSYTSFSRTGLVGQLEFEGFSTEDATFAVDYIAPDWNAQAAAKAADYLAYTSFSREGLIEQLVFEGFTAEQAAFGASANGY